MIRILEIPISDSRQAILLQIAVDPVDEVGIANQDAEDVNLTIIGCRADDGNWF